MSSQSDSQDISREPSVQKESYSDVESSSEQPSMDNDLAVAEEVQSSLRVEMEAEDFEQIVEDEEMALALQVAEEEEEKERQEVTVAALPSRGAGGASTSRALDVEPISVAHGKRKTKTKAAPKKKKEAAVDVGKPVDIPEGYSYLNVAALSLKSRATQSEYLTAQFLVGPEGRVVEPKPDDVLSQAPEGCFAVHLLSLDLGLRFPLHPFLVEYLRFVKLAPCQLTPNSHSYIAGFLSLCRSREIDPSLDLFFMCFNLCRGGHTHAEGFANLQQVPEWRLFSEVPSSHKGWKDKFCYVRMAVNPFAEPLKDRFRRHLKVGSAALQKAGKKLSAKPEGSDKQITIKSATLPDELYKLGFKRYRRFGEKDENYPLIDMVPQSAGGPAMDLKAITMLRNKLEKEQKKKEGKPSTQKPVDEFFPKADTIKAPVDEGSSKKASAAAEDVVGSDAGGSAAEGQKKRRTGKGAALPEKRQKKGGAEKVGAPLVIIDEQAPVVTPPRSPPAHIDEDLREKEVIHFPIQKGTAVMHSTLNPIEFMRGVMSPKDRLVLSRLEDDVLDYKIASYSTMAALGFSEQARRVEALRIAKGQADEGMKKLAEELTEAKKQLADARDTLRLEREGAAKKLEDAKAEAKSDAEKVAAEAAKKAAEEAENAKAEAVSKAREDAVASFVSEGWRADDQKAWRSAVVGAEVDEWVKGPGAEWLALKGNEYWQGGEFFTQRLIYRKLAAHQGVDLKDFKPDAFGLPPLQPDVRVPLPEGMERPILRDSLLLQECGADDEEAGDGATSKIAEEGAKTSDT
ncbi:unnamed protein product [Cuscuta epithymum]|uniref:Transposase (putative) gypsy type domain-containing protein n=1 Tax=Cuscuta epithymum TaxID=186058 RepID=A0AAV0DIW4_9ASTE|nr:unnamed protein product [Cuscuta epithymum]